MYKISFLDAVNIVSAPLVVALTKNGVEVTETPDETCDFFWNASVLKYRESHRISRKFPDVMTVNYVWDFYEWAWEGGRKNSPYDWKGYSEYLKESADLWVPSNSVKMRMSEYFDIDAHIIKTGIDVKDQERKPKAYVLNHLREYPEVNWGITKKACKELNYPYLWPDHGLELSEWHRTVANSRFMVAEYYEASTGGLTLIEGLWNGVPSLVANSPYQGGCEYLQEFGTYFQWDDYEDFKEKLKEMYENPPKIDVKKARAFIRKNYSYDKMAKEIIKRMDYLYEKRERAKKEN